MDVGVDGSLLAPDQVAGGLGSSVPSVRENAYREIPCLPM